MGNLNWIFIVRPSGAVVSRFFSLDDFGPPAFFTFTRTPVFGFSPPVRRKRSLGRGILPLSGRTPKFTIWKAGTRQTGPGWANLVFSELIG